jgi:hypothetical protein
MAFMNSVLFLSYGQAKAWMQGKDKQELTIPKYWICGAMVGFCVSFVESPGTSFLC